MISVSAAEIGAVGLACHPGDGDGMDAPGWQASPTVPISAADTEIMYGDHLMWLY